MEMKGKRVEESRGVMAQLMNPYDANSIGNVHGGVIMRMIDSAAGVVAIRHCRTNVVTASIDRLDLLRPVFIGDLVTLRASINMAGTTSMEIGVRVDAENLRTGEVRKVATAYLTFVALGQDGRPTPVPPLILETGEDIRRNNEAKARRQARLPFKSKSKP
jgi:acyl-CoA hydrolase